MVHKDLEVWKKSISFSVIIYNITEKFPLTEKFGLVQQMRRAAVSIPSNIAEGSGRRGDKELCQFLYIALGSLAELDTQLIIAGRLKLIDNQIISLENDITEIRKMLLGLLRKIKIKNNT